MAFYKRKLRQRYPYEIIECPQTMDSPWIEITKEEYDKIQQKLEILDNINELKTQLDISDYKVIKNLEIFMNSFADVLKTLDLPYDINVLTKERQEARDQINKLETSITNE